MTLEEFREEVLEQISSMPTYWRKGQKVFNYIDAKYGVAREVQYNKGVDCFYNDFKIDEFIEASYNILYNL